MNKFYSALYLLFSLNALSQTTYFVNDNASGAGNGSSWTDAFTKLQDALAAVGNGDQIWVAAGIYYPDEGVGLTNNDRSLSFQLKTGIAIYGGFAGTETQLSERNVTTNITTLSGDIQQDNDSTNNAFHVVQSSSVDNTTVLDGFTITRGNANGANFPDNQGGGMYNIDSSPTLTNCSFSANSAVIDGGGMSNYASSPKLTHCSFSANTVGSGGGGGGGMYNIGSSPTLTNCIFSGNTVVTNGGGIFNGDSSSPILTNCSFSANSASNYGGGMLNYISSSPTLTNCSFSANTAGSGGGMLSYISSSPTLTNCSFSANSASTYGGGMFNETGSLTFTNCSFTKNTAELGGGMYNGYSSISLVNCSFSANMANNGGGIYNNFNTSSTLTNCILWGNSIGEIVNGEGGRSTVTYSIIEGGYTGIGNLDQDPLFVDAASGDLHLQPNSPAIDAGLNSANTTSVDLDSNPRVVNGTIDMGAFEFQRTGIVVFSFTLIDPNTDVEIRALEDGDTINLATLTSTQLSIRANTTPPTTGSVVFSLTGPQSRNHTENLAPYALFLNNKEDYFGSTLPPGDYTLTATPYNGARGTGEPGTPHTIHFHVIYQVVNNFTLINADTDQDIRELKDVDVIDLSTLPAGIRLSIRANTNPATVGSVVFDINGPVGFKRTENTAPYALLENNMNDYSGIIPPVGDYTLTATPYSGAKVSGHKGVTSTISFSVVNNNIVTSVEPKLNDVTLQVSGNLRAAPNPFRGQTTISFSVPQTGYTALEVIDHGGAVLERLYAAQAQAGHVYSLSFNSKQLRRGVYVLRLISGKHVQSYQLMLMQ